MAGGQGASLQGKYVRYLAQGDMNHLLSHKDKCRTSDSAGAGSRGSQLPRCIKCQGSTPSFLWLQLLRYIISNHLYAMRLQVCMMHSIPRHQRGDSRMHCTTIKHRNACVMPAVQSMENQVYM